MFNFIWLNSIWKFIEKKFSKMPTWVQNSTYLILLFLVVYFFLTPNFFDGELTAFKTGKKSRPLPKSILEVYVGHGRWVRLYTKMDGRFTLPAPSKFPLSKVKIRYYPDGSVGGYLEESVRYYKMWHREIVLEYKPDNESGKDFYLIHASTIHNGYATPIKSAYAETTANPTGITHKEPEKDNFRQFIIQTISAELGRDIKPSEQTTNLRELGINNVKLAFVLGDIRDKFGIEISSDVWEYAETINDLVLFSREEYYMYRPWGDHDSSRIEKLNELFDSAKKGYPIEDYKKYRNARLLRKAEKPFIAINILKDIIKKHPDFYLAWYDLAISSRAANQHNLAKSYFMKAIELEKSQKLGHAAVYNTYGRYLYHLCEAEESLKYLNQALEIDPNYGFLKQYIADSKALSSGKKSLSTCN